MKLKIFFLFVLTSFGLSVHSQSLTKVWSTSSGLKTPESALFDAKTNQIYVTNIDGDPSAKDGNGFISVLDIDGKMKTLKWVTGLNAPKGQAIHNGILYVADIDEVVLISIKDAKITKRVKLANAKFLNDVTASEDGTVFVTDMRDNKIYVLSNDQLTLWLEGQLITNPNGLWAEKGKLYIGTGQLLQADLKTKEIKVLADNCGGIDGLEKLESGEFVYSNWPGRIFVTNKGQSVKLLDTVDKMNTADIDYVPGKKLVLVPTFSANSLDAYTLNP
jgi:DNA-binding beta-propeller fold protein YncE